MHDLITHRLTMSPAPMCRPASPMALWRGVPNSPADAARMLARCGGHPTATAPAATSEELLLAA